jgi:predicted HicB family RNase H-like nuclease
MDKASGQRDYVAVSVRLEPDLHRAARQLALDKRSSLNKEINAALARHLEEARRERAGASHGR